MSILTARVLDGFPHGFTTRQGGVSSPPFATLNLGEAVGDDPARVAANWERVREATGLGFARVHQVHKSAVARAGGSPAAAPLPEADAVVSDRPGLAACVSVADCVPVLLADPRSGAVAAAHAGWRGTLARVVEAALRALERDHAARPGEVVAAVGPSIGPCCYEVSAELAERFRQEFGPAVGNPRRRESRVDLWRANEVVLRGCGVHPSRIETLGRCTSCELELFFSYRRDGARTGRQIGFIAPRPEASRSPAS